MGLAAEDVDTVPVAVDGDALLRRIDLRVIPILFVIYLAAFLDRYPPLQTCYPLSLMPSRVNIANAITLGLPVDLHLDAKTNQTNVALTIFFVPYIIFEIPSNFLLRHFKPPVWCASTSHQATACISIDRWQYLAVFCCLV